MTEGPWYIEEDREGGRVVYRILALGGDVVIGTIDGVKGCLEGELTRLPAEENKANAEAIAEILNGTATGWWGGGRR